MAISKKRREEVKNKFNGLCAYSGKPLDEKWQVDHIRPKSRYQWVPKETREDCDVVENLLPTIRIVNHYKRSLDLEGFRRYMLTFHERLKKLPKKTTVERTINRIKYLNDVAVIFDLAVDKPFSGIFYFETLEKNEKI